MLAGSWIVGMVTNVTFLLCKFRRLAAMASSLATDPRPGSTVSALVAVLAIDRSLTGLSRTPWLSIFWMSEDMNSCCSSIRPRSLPSPTPCLVRTNASASFPVTRCFPAERSRWL